MRSARKTFHFFCLDTGLYGGRSITAGEEVASAAAAEASCVAVADVEFPWAVQWIDGELREYRGPSPGDDYEWNEALRRWWLKPDIEAARSRREAAAAQIAALEGRQARAIRELALDYPGARERLQSIDDQIATLRQVINN